MKRASFRTMDDGTAEDYEIIEAAGEVNDRTIPRRMLELVRALEEGEQAFPVSRYVHSLQSATRALRDDRPVDYVVGALLHDVGDTYSPHQHGKFASVILEPYVDPKVTWIVKVHGLFQMYHYAPFMGGEKNARDRHRDNPWFDDAAEFCAKYDANCFDPDYDHFDLATFAPMVEQVFTRAPWSHLATP